MTRSANAHAVQDTTEQRIRTQTRKQTRACVTIQGLPHNPNTSKRGSSQIGWPCQTPCGLQITEEQSEVGLRPGKDVFNTTGMKDVPAAAEVRH